MIQGSGIGIILQARMGSTRLPGKVLADLNGMPLLKHILLRWRWLDRWPLVVATTHRPEDDVIERFCEREATPCFRGDPSDVLDRYLSCARAFGFGQIIRWTGDNPFVDVEYLPDLVAGHVAGGFDYSNNFAGLPLGCGSEVMTRLALERSAAEGYAPDHREHVDEYILQNPALFRCRIRSEPLPQFHSQRWTVDLPVDLAQARERARKAGKPPAPLARLLAP
jgi:spore coat polysaccharide biosynthesis protein SpsF